MLKRYTPLRRSTKPLKRSRIARVSTKRRRDQALYLNLRKVFLAQHEGCQVKTDGCTTWATDVHHRKGRGKYLCAVETFTAACRRCHDHIHVHPAWAREVGWLQK